MSATPRRKSSRNRIPSLRLRESQESEQLQQSHQSRPRGRGCGGRGGRRPDRGGRGAGSRGGRGGLVGAGAGSEPDEAGEDEDDDQEGSQEAAYEGDAAVAAELTAVRGRPSYSAQLWRNTTETAADNRPDGFSTAPSFPTSPPAPLSPCPATRGSAAVPDSPAAAPDGLAALCLVAKIQTPSLSPHSFLTRPDCLIKYCDHCH